MHTSDSGEINANLKHSLLGKSIQVEENDRLECIDVRKDPNFPR